jgi:hypothetical protein
VLALGRSILDEGRKRLLLDAGGRYAGPGRYDCDYLAVGWELADGLVASPFLNYAAAPHSMIAIHANRILTLDLDKFRKAVGGVAFALRTRACYGGAPDPTEDRGKAEGGVRRWWAREPGCRAWQGSGPRAPAGWPHLQPDPWSDRAGSV